MPIQLIGFFVDRGSKAGFRVFAPSHCFYIVILWTPVHKAIDRTISCQLMLASALTFDE